MFELIRHKTSSHKADILSGLTVAMALVPEAVAFAFVAKVEPMVGLYAAFIMGLITALIGGRPGMISGATGAMAVVMTSLVVSHGVSYLFAAVVLAGIIQITAGALRLGKFIRIVPYPVMIGFVNGLAIVIFLAQLGQFQVKVGEEEMAWLPGADIWLMLALIAMTMAIIHFLPKLTTAVPSSLVAILAVTALVVGLDLDTRNVLDYLRNMSGNPEATIAGTLPSFAIPAVPFNLETLYIIAPYAVILAAVGLIESLLTLTVVTVFTDLAIAVFVGVIVSALVFAWEHAKQISAQKSIDANGWAVYRLNGPLFFGSAASFLELFDANNDPKDVVVDFQSSRVCDHSALDAIDTLAERYVNQGKRLHLRHLSNDCKQLLHKAGDLVEVNLIEDPRYKIADDKLDS